MIKLVKEEKKIKNWYFSLILNIVPEQNEHNQLVTFLAELGASSIYTILLSNKALWYNRFDLNSVTRSRWLC